MIALLRQKITAFRSMLIRTLMAAGNSYDNHNHGQAQWSRLFTLANGPLKQSVPRSEGKLILIMEAKYPNL